MCFKYVEHNKAYKRHKTQVHMRQKENIVKNCWGIDFVSSDFTPTILLQPHRLDKGKVHCSCPMCSEKTKRDGWKHRDAVKRLPLIEVGRFRNVDCRCTTFGAGGGQWSALLATRRALYEKSLLTLTTYRGGTESFTMFTHTSQARGSCNVNLEKGWEMSEEEEACGDDIGFYHSSNISTDRVVYTTETDKDIDWDSLLDICEDDREEIEFAEAISEEEM